MAEQYQKAARGAIRHKGIDNGWLKKVTCRIFFEDFITLTIDAVHAGVHGRSDRRQKIRNGHS
jgi:hypothetical protein